MVSSSERAHNSKTNKNVGCCWARRWLKKRKPQQSPTMLQAVSLLLLLAAKETFFCHAHSQVHVKLWHYFLGGESIWILLRIRGTILLYFQSLKKVFHSCSIIIYLYMPLHIKGLCLMIWSRNETMYYAKYWINYFGLYQKYGNFCSD